MALGTEGVAVLLMEALVVGSSAVGSSLLVYNGILAHPCLGPTSRSWERHGRLE